MDNIKVNAFRDGDPDYQLVDGDGGVHPGGRTVAEWRQLFGGNEGVVTHPKTKERLPLSLAPYAHLDPNTTRLQIAFRNPHPNPTSEERTARAAEESGTQRIVKRGKRVDDFLKGARG